jgi:hypothetical protein
MENSDRSGLSLLCATMIGLPAMLVLLTALVPGYVRRTHDVIRKWPGRSFMLGLVNFVFFLALAMLVNFAARVNGHLVSASFLMTVIGAFSLFLILPLVLSVGLLAAAGIVGDRLWQQIASKPASLVGSLALGVPLMVLTLLVPILGWLLFLGLVLAGLGAAVIALGQVIVDRFRGNRTSQEPVPPMAEPIDQPMR